METNGNPLKRFFGVEYLIPKEKRLGDLPSDKEVYGRAFRMAWPSALETVLISLISSMDMIMVSGLGSAAVAAVGITDQPKFIIMATVLALNTGVTVIVARRKGQNNPEDANRALRNAILLSLGLSFALSAFGILFAKPVLALAGAGKDYLDIATGYFKIIMIGNFFTCVGLTMTSAQRGAGNTKISMKTNLTANIVNVIFNYLLINGIGPFPRLEVTGAALATMIGNIVSFAMAVYSISRPGGFLQLSLKQDWKPNMDAIHQLSRISSASLVEQWFIRIGFFMYTRAVAGLGTDAFATHNICMKVINLSFAVGDGLSIASSSLVGSHLGMKRADLSMVYCKAIGRIGMSIAALLAIFEITFRIPILTLFSQGNEVIVRLGEPVMFLIAVTVAMQIGQVITFGALRGAGDLKFVALLMMISVTCVRPGLTYLLCYGFGWGLNGAWVALLIDQCLRNLSSSLRFSQGHWMSIQV
ncbi:MAG: MATE family efflux transporter [Erysipelotrichaceae bacterium]|jgi:putative MATE family efflux protein|nr:MATE family efflux transporter [Erysipelotrichaceae bacterium]